MEIKTNSKFNETELKINRNLYRICAFITLVAVFISLIEFFSRGDFPPGGLNIFYIGILLIYTFHKELLRWLGEKAVERQGEFFVYLWIILTTILYITNFLTKNYFSYTSQGMRVEALREISMIALEVASIFVLSRMSKIIKMISEKKAETKSR